MINGDAFPKGFVSAENSDLPDIDRRLPMTIADTIRSLKPGDRVRVTREQDVDFIYGGGKVYSDGTVATKTGPHVNPGDPTITSIEVIERPLQVGDRVRPVTDDHHLPGTVVASHKGRAWVEWDGEPLGYHSLIFLSDLRRAS
jgi:hypothetical protein